MAKTWGDIITEARVILQDVDSPYRDSDATLRSILNRGLNELARLRPDAFWDLFDTDDVVVPTVALSDPDPPADTANPTPAEQTTVLSTDDFLLPMQFYNPLVYWVAGVAELKDDEFTNDARAAILMSQFKAQVVAL